MRIEVRAEDRAPAPSPQTPSSGGPGGEREQPGDRGRVAREVGATESVEPRKGRGLRGKEVAALAGKVDRGDGAGLAPH